jgi:hypothetical protein
VLITLVQQRRVVVVRLLLAAVDVEKRARRFS